MKNRGVWWVSGIIILIALLIIPPVLAAGHIETIADVTASGATFTIDDAPTEDVWIEYGRNPEGMFWRSAKVSAAGGVATIAMYGSPVMTSTLYYAKACSESEGCSAVSESFTTNATSGITETNYGAGFTNLTDSHYNIMFIAPAILGGFLLHIPAIVFFGLIQFFIVLGLWRANRGVRVVSILFIICAPLLFAADTGLFFGIPGVMQSLGAACLAVGIAGILLSFVHR